MAEKAETPMPAPKVRLPLNVDAETRKAVESLAKMEKCEFADVLAKRSLAQAVRDFNEIRALVG